VAGASPLRWLALKRQQIFTEWPRALRAEQHELSLHRQKLFATRRFLSADRNTLCGGGLCAAVAAPRGSRRRRAGGSASAALGSASAGPGEERWCQRAGRSRAGWRGASAGVVFPLWLGQQHPQPPRPGPAPSLLPTSSPAAFTPSSAQEMGVRRSARLRSFGGGPSRPISPSIASAGQWVRSIALLPARSRAWPHRGRRAGEHAYPRSRNHRFSGRAVRFKERKASTVLCKKTNWWISKDVRGDKQAGRSQARSLLHYFSRSFSY